MTYTEDALVEQPAINLFSELNWDTVTTTRFTKPSTRRALLLKTARQNQELSIRPYWVKSTGLCLP